MNYTEFDNEIERVFPQAVKDAEGIDGDKTIFIFMSKKNEKMFIALKSIHYKADKYIQVLKIPTWCLQDEYSMKGTIAQYYDKTLMRKYVIESTRQRLRPAIERARREICGY